MVVSLFEPRKGSRFSEQPEVGSEKARQPLPAWPLYTLLYGYPIIWVLGLSQFMPSILSVIMVFYMVLRRRILMFSSHWIWLALIIWTVVCTVSLDKGTDIIAWTLRFLVIFNAGVYSVYFLNARERVTTQGVMGGLISLWYTVVILGWLALFFPDFRLTTPVGMLMPSGLVSNELVRNYVLPPLAEVQQPWGAPEPFIRPSAPFPYANSWGLAYSFLTPVVLAMMTAATRMTTKVILGISVVASLYPAIATSNRGMFIGLGICLAYIIFRQVLAGNLKVAVAAIAGTAVAVAGLIYTGAFAQILGRQEYSDSTGGRASLYMATWEEVLKSPLIGYGNPRMNVTVGVSMGTQGYLWTLMFCFGLVGLGLFIAFMLHAILSTWNVQSSTAIWIHSVPVVAAIVFSFYSFDTMQMASMMLCLSIIIRSIVYREDL